MKKRSMLIIICISIIVLISIVVILITKNKNKKEWNNDFSKIDKNEINYKEDVNVSELKNELGLTGEDNLYEVFTEYDGRKSLNIKPEIQYKVAFAGIVKNDKPDINEIDHIFNSNYPKEKGIWISEKSRNIFLELLGENTNTNYSIDEKGYLKIERLESNNNIDKALNQVINSNKTIIIDISNIDYEIDIVSRRSS